MSEEPPAFERFNTARSTVARRCREYYHRRLERTEILQRRWSVCKDEHDQATNGQEISDDKRSDLSSDSSDSPLFRKCLESGFKSLELSSLPSGNDSGHASDSSESPPVDFPEEPSSSGSPTASDTRTCYRPRSSLDIAMDNLRKEISSLIAQDNDLFRQLLSLNDSIAELRVQQEKNMSLWDGDYDSEHESLESISDEETTSTVSPASTLSSCCSSHHLDSSKNTPLDWPTVLPTESGRQRSFCRTLVPSDGCTGRQRTRSVLCLRCHIKGAAPLYRRRAASSSNLLWRQAGGRYEMESFDSGIHIHSDSDHEIFV